jgi:hypothetical protein
MKSFCPTFYKKGVAPPTQDATRPAEKIGSGEKVCFFYTFLQAINKKLATGGIDSCKSYLLRPIMPQKQRGQEPF